MTQEERREYLINYLLKEEIRIGRYKIPADKQGQEELLRSLMNVRPPKTIREEFRMNILKKETGNGALLILQTWNLSKPIRDFISGRGILQHLNVMPLLMHAIHRCWGAFLRCMPVSTILFIPMPE